MLPLSFVPLRFLAFSSFLGVLTTWGIIGILCFSGLATYVTEYLKLDGKLVLTHAGNMLRDH